MTEKDFTAKWTELIRGELKNFPDDFIGNDKCQEILLPGKILFLPSPLFNCYQIIDENGETIYSTDDHFKAKYVIYANRIKPVNLKMPVSELRVYEVVRDYEKYLDSILKEIETDFKITFPASKGFKRASAQIFNSLNLVRH